MFAAIILVVATAANATPTPTATAAPTPMPTATLPWDRSIYGTRRPTILQMIDERTGRQIPTATPAAGPTGSGLTRRPEVGDVSNSGDHHQSKVRISIVARPTPTPSLLELMIQTRDQVEGITWYQHFSSEASSRHSGARLYFGKRDDGVLGPLRMVLSYRGDKWVFFDKVKIKTRSARLEIPAGDVRRDVEYGGEVTEQIDVAAKGALWIILQNVIAENGALVRFEGRNEVSDVALRTDEVEAMRTVVAAYQSLGGVLESNAK